MEQTIHERMAAFGYREMRTPAFESLDLFERGIGPETEIVNKEMYTFTDLSGKFLALKPESTASVIRAYLENNLNREAPLARIYYLDTLFRQERPQKGRFRQFHQFGAEAIGSPHPEQDIEIISLAYDLCNRFGPDLTIRLNTIGEPDSRKPFLTLLQKSLEPHAAALAPLDRGRLQSNPLRIFDSKDQNTQDLLDRHAPLIHEHVSPADSGHFATVMAGLKALGLPVTHDPKLVRGLDYYTRTTFEIIATGLGSQDAVCGGGRYDHLVEELGGPSIPAVGFAAGMERLLMAAGDQLAAQVPVSQVDVYFIFNDQAAMQPVLELAREVRAAGYSVMVETLRRSMKAQFREANRNGARAVLIMGADELAAGSVTLKVMETGHQDTVALAGVGELLAGHLRPTGQVAGH